MWNEQLAEGSTSLVNEVVNGGGTSGVRTAGGHWVAFGGWRERVSKKVDGGDQPPGPCHEISCLRRGQPLGVNDGVTRPGKRSGRRFASRSFVRFEGWISVAGGWRKRFRKNRSKGGSTPYPCCAINRLRRGQTPARLTKTPSERGGLVGDCAAMSKSVVRSAWAGS